MTKPRGIGHPLLPVFCMCGRERSYRWQKWDFGAFLGCVAGNGLSSFWLVFTINGTAESDFSQWLMCFKTGKELTRRADRSTECADRTKLRERRLIGEKLRSREVTRRA